MAIFGKEQNEGRASMGPACRAGLIPGWNEKRQPWRLPWVRARPGSGPVELSTIYEGIEMGPVRRGSSITRQKENGSRKGCQGVGPARIETSTPAPCRLSDNLSDAGI